MAILCYRYSDNNTNLTISEKLNIYLPKFRNKFKLNPSRIILNPVYENEIGNKFNNIFVEYKSTLNLEEIKFEFPSFYVLPSQVSY